MGRLSREEEIIRRAQCLLGAAGRKAAPDAGMSAGKTDALCAVIAHAADVRPGDDCAVFRCGNIDLLITTDMLVEGTHFVLPHFPKPPYADFLNLGWKTLSVNVSDVAACGGEPLGYLVALGLPAAASDAEIAAFTRGLAQASRAYGIAIWGGDVVASERWTISITTIGAVNKGRALTRTGARPGDALVLSGHLGLARVGLEVTHPLAFGIARSAPPDKAEYPAALKAISKPVAQIGLGRFLRENRLASAAIDLSDSLAKSVRLIALESGCGATVDLSALKLHPEVRKFMAWKGLVKDKEKTQFLLDAAEDYSLLFTVPKRKLGKLFEAANADWLIQRIPLAVIGEMATGEELRVMIGGKPAKMKETGYEHF